ncbi:MAG TPA: hypothetical protein VGD01_18215 [Candidatus Elarobacter sp.]|jgi:hypothetical protein
MRKLTIESIQANSGFLEDAKIVFSPNLTCVIGARGTCKSTIVESMRYALAVGDKEEVRKLAESGGKVFETLGPGSIRCVVQSIEDGEVNKYVVEREVDGDPRISRHETREPASPDVLNDLEIYSQGDLQKIASSKDPAKQLQLIDRPNRIEIERLQHRMSTAIAELQAIGSKLRTARLEIEKRKTYIRDIDTVRKQLDTTLTQRPALPPTLQEQHTAYLKRQRTLEHLVEVRALQQALLATISEAIKIGSSADSLRARIATDESHSEISLQLINALAQTVVEIEGVRARIELIPVAIRTTELHDAFDLLNREYYEQRQQEVALSESLKAEDRLKRQLSDLEKAERELSEYISSTRELAATRSFLRSVVIDLRDTIYGMRVNEADQINGEFGDVVVLSVERAATSLPYIARISSLLGGSRIRAQEDIAKDLATTFRPAELLDIIEAGDAQRVANALDRDLGQITRAITYLRDHPDLYELEGDWADDSLQITMYDHGVPKAVEDLSAGQRATALLPLILRDSPWPLIIDQPEDDLDNSFIFEVLVHNILRLKPTRQLIFITHNANIPVLGEAEQVVVMHMDSPTKAGPPLTGSLDDRKADILHLLEGGREAFDRRERQYRAVTL